MDRRIVFFLHLPKAAGSTLNRVISQQFPPQAIYKAGRTPRAQLLADVAAMTPASPVRTVTGHFAFGLHEVLPQPFTYITVLRDPVERILSHYHYARKLPRHPLHAEIANGLSLVEVARRLANLQTRYLADDAARGTSETAGAATLHSAKENLSRHFSVAGLAERFDETLLLLHRHLGWKIRPVMNSNVTRGRPTRRAHDEDELRSIREINSLDCELHAWVRERFEAETTRAGGAFRTQVAWLRLRNRVLQLGGQLSRRKATAS